MVTRDPELRRIPGACPHDCPDTCGVITEVRDGEAVGFRADPAHPVTRGWLCAKVRPYLDHVHHPDRLRVPLRRIGPKGSDRWERVGWDEALATIGRRWRAIAREHGPEAILPYSYSGTLGLVQMRVSSARLWNRLGASQLARTICDAATSRAVEATLGGKYAPPYRDVAHSRLVILWAHNPASTAPHFMPHLRAAQKRGCRVVVIDPRRTRSARGADWHVAPVPGTDGALALGLAHVIAAEGLHDEGWLNAHALGWPELRRRLGAYPPARVAGITGVSESEIVRLARAYATARPSLIKIADGIGRNLGGGQTTRAVCALPAITGQYGTRGGGLAYSTSDYLPWDDEAIAHRGGSPPPGRVVNMNRLGAALLGEVDAPPIKSLFVFGANPAASSPNAGAIVRGLAREDLFTVVHELFMTDTARYADLVLPATSQLEHTDLHKGYGHTLLTYNHAAIPPLGESRSNWDVMRALAAEMGFSEPWLRQTADEVIAEVVEATAARTPSLEGITLSRLKTEASVPLPVGDAVPYAGGRFETPSGKVELRCDSLARDGLDPLPEWDGREDDGGVTRDSGLAASRSLILLTGASHHFVSSSLAGQESLLRKEGDPFVEIHPEDAADRGIRDGDEVVVENGRGGCALRARVTEAVRRGVLASPKGRWSRLSGGRNINWTTSDALADLAGQSTFHSNRVWIRAKTGP